MTEGIESRPRNESIREINYFRATIANPWSTYEGRNYPLSYLKKEFQWYLNADPTDMRICKYAKMWAKIVNNGRIFSNYGYYWFNKDYLQGISGFDWVVNSLKKDPFSRQAYIPMNGRDHIFEGNRDVVCTKGVQFRILDGSLVMHADMRSSDAIFGMGTDLPIFRILQEMVATELGLPTGPFVFSADSIHIYEKHFKMVDDILHNGVRSFIHTEYPKITDVNDLLTGSFQSEFGKWLIEDGTL